MVATAAHVAPVRRFPIEVRALSSYDDIRAKREEFQVKVADGSVTTVDLIWHILTIDDIDMPQSLGMDWIRNNPTEFAGIVGNVDAFLEEVLRLAELDLESDDTEVKAWDGLHGLRYWFLRSFIGSKDLMALLSPAWRVRYVRDIYPRIGAHTMSWISTAVLSGITRDTIATAILQRLRRVEINKGVVNDVEDFLRYGGGHDLHAAPIHAALWRLELSRDGMQILRPQIETDPSAGFPEIERRLHVGVKPREDRILGGFPEIPPWFALSNTELAEALRICATKAPAQTLQILRDERVRPRLQPADEDAIVTMATQRMDTIMGVSLETLEGLLDLTDREALARQLKPVQEHYLHAPTAQFLFRIICELSPYEARRRFWQEVIVPVLKPASAAAVYKAWRQMQLEEDDVESELRSRLDEEGYILSTIRRGSHQGKVQWFVDVRGTRYVQDRYEHRYFPTEGDLVLFKPTSGHRLTPTVMAVTFIPVMKDVR